MDTIQAAPEGIKPPASVVSVNGQRIILAESDRIAVYRIAWVIRRSRGQWVARCPLCFGEHFHGPPEGTRKAECGQRAPDGAVAEYYVRHPESSEPIFCRGSRIPAGGQL